MCSYTKGGGSCPLCHPLDPPLKGYIQIHNKPEEAEVFKSTQVSQEIDREEGKESDGCHEDVAEPHTLLYARLMLSTLHN